MIATAETDLTAGLAATRARCRWVPESRPRPSPSRVHLLTPRIGGERSHGEGLGHGVAHRMESEWDGPPAERPSLWRQAART